MERPRRTVALVWGLGAFALSGAVVLFLGGDARLYNFLFIAIPTATSIASAYLAFPLMRRFSHHSPRVAILIFAVAIPITAYGILSIVVVTGGVDCGAFLILSYFGCLSVLASPLTGGLLLMFGAACGIATHGIIDRSKRMQSDL